MTYPTDPRIDAYIKALPGWQQTVCREVRDLVHLADTEVTESSENRVYAFHQTGGFLASGTTRFDIEPTQQGSKVTWTAEYELPYSYLGKLVDKLRVRKQFEEAIDESIKGLKSRVER